MPNEYYLLGAAIMIIAIIIDNIIPTLFKWGKAVITNIQMKWK